VSRSLVLTYSYLSGIHCNWPTSLSVQRVIRLLPASVCFANKSAQREWRPDSPTKTPRRGTYFVRPVCVYGEPGLALSEPCHLARSVYRLRSRSRVAPIHILSKPDSASSLLPRHTRVELRTLTVTAVVRRSPIMHSWQVALGCTCLRTHSSVLGALHVAHISSPSLHRA